MVKMEQILRSSISNRPEGLVAFRELQMRALIAIQTTFSLTISEPTYFSERSPSQGEIYLKNIRKSRQTVSKRKGEETVGNGKTY